MKIVDCLSASEENTISCSTTLHSYVHNKILKIWFVSNDKILVCSAYERIFFTHIIVILNSINIIFFHTVEVNYSTIVDRTKVLSLKEGRNLLLHVQKTVFYAI